MSVKTNSLFAPSPTAEKGRSIKIDNFKDEAVIYTNGRGVFIRNLEDPAKTVAYFGHAREATVARVSPSGYYVASGDTTGAVRIWDVAGDDQVLKNEVKVISGRINDLAWDGESKRLIAVGDGRERFGHAFTFDSGSTVGEISGHSKVVNTCAIRPLRPFKAITAGDDNSLVFYSGVPFKFDKVLRPHSSFIHSVAYSASGSHFLSASADRKVILYDGTTAEVVSTLAGHEGGVFAAAFSKDSKTILSASADSTVRLWDVETGKESSCWKLSQQQLGGRFVGEKPVSVALSGDINVFDHRSPDAPTQILHGAQKSITALAVSAVEPRTLFAGSYDGRITAFSQKGDCRPLHGSGHTNQVVAITNSSDDTLITAGMDDTIRSLEAGSASFQSSFANTSTIPKALTSDANGNAYLVTANEIQIMNGTTKAKSLPISYPATCIAHSTVSTQIAVGGQDGKIRIYDSSLKLVETLEKNRNGVTALAFSPDGALLAIGESTGKIIVLDAKTNELKFNQWAFHTARISSIQFSPDSLYALTASLDTNLYVYSVTKPTKKLAIKNAHYGGVAGAAWINETSIASAGADAVVKIHQITLPA